ncbi:MAG: J domain-containing protein [Hyphomicrobiaceae bacterium]|nr:J domain-containing protein [Hyphomicrobiaceae bacterium]
MPNFYDVLGVDPDADDEQIRDAFASLAKVFHPDLNADDGQTERRFKEIRQAYSTLRDPRTRAAYELGLVHQRKSARRRISTAMMMGFTTSMLCTIIISLMMVWLLTDGREVSVIGQNAYAQPKDAVSVPHDGSPPRR